MQKQKVIYFVLATVFVSILVLIVYLAFQNFKERERQEPPIEQEAAPKKTIEEMIQDTTAPIDATTSIDLNTPVIKELIEQTTAPESIKAADFDEENQELIIDLTAPDALE